MLLFPLRPATAEPLGAYLHVTPFGGYTMFDTDQRSPAPRVRPMKDDMYFGGRLGVQTLRWLGLELAGGYTPAAEDVVGGRDVQFFHGSGNIALMPYSGRYGGPFVSFGGGAARLSSAAARTNQMNAEFAAGLQLWLNDVIGLRLEARDLAWLPKKDITSPKAHNLIFGGGISFAIGNRTRDSDGDGVPDSRDRCPNTPRGALADANGCPLDSDDDSVVDGLDQCPDTPKGAAVNAQGCPNDTDGDGVFDGIDQCAGTPANAMVDATGCPLDTDGDGVFDGLDQCADTPKGAIVDEKGCPSDADNDGVPDGLDNCPGTSPGLKVDKDGCPIEVVDRETELLDTGMIRLQDVRFETAKAELLPEALPQLDIVGQVLSKWPELRIEIGGHTDSRGSTAYNKQLSEARVTSVLNYLLGRFPNLKLEQYSIKGYGESKPLVANNNAANMAKNRRVEFKVLNTDVLKREIQHRKLLKKE